MGLLTGQENPLRYVALEKKKTSGLTNNNVNLFAEVEKALAIQPLANYAQLSPDAKISGKFRGRIA